jgi:gliding motility-associated-like protein
MQNSVYLTVGLHNMLIYYGQEDTGSRLLLEYSGPGVARTVVNSNVLCSSRQPLVSGVPVSVSYSPALGVKITGQTFNSTVPAVNNGGSPITQYSLTSATAQPLPAGITVGTNGVISADASVPVGDYSINLTLVNANGVTNFARVYKLVVSAAPLGVCGGTDPGGNPASVGFYAEYYSGSFNDDPNFFVTNTPGLVRVPDAPLDYSNSFLSSQAPIAGSNPQNFSAQYRSNIYIATAGTYTFYLTTDDGGFLWLDNAALDRPAQISKAAINHGGAHGAFTKQVSVNLAVGLHPMLVQYGQGAGTSRLMLEYEGPGIVRQVIPANVLCTSVPRPVAVNDSYETDANVPLQAASVLLNDSSPTGIALTVNTTPQTNPLHGSVTLQPNGTFVYTPSTGYIGQDSFTYEVCNSNNSSYCSQGVVSLIVNDPAYTRVGSAFTSAANCFILTKNEANQAGAIWRKNPLSLSTSFEVNFNARFSASGTTKDAGADGITFTLQSMGLNALGSNGSGMGYSSITPSLGVEFDTFAYPGNATELPEDHVAVNLNGNNVTNVAGPIQASATAVNIEDGIYHAIRIIWNKTENKLEIYFDGTLRLTYTNDVINNVFGGNPTVYAGFTAGTGVSFNEQGVCDIVFSAINSAPVAVNDSYSTSEDTPLNIVAPGVLTNDTDVDNDALTSVLVSNPGNGAVTLNPNGSFTYTPGLHFNGSDSFTYRTSDGSLTSNIATVTITVNPVNDAPVFTKGANQTVNENAGLQTVAGWATSIDDGDPELTQTLTFTVTNNNNALFSVQPTISATGTLTYTPAPNVSGVATVTVTLSDNGSNIAPNVNISATQTFTITVSLINSAPVFTKGANQTVNENAGPQTVVGWASGIDDGDPELTQTLTFTLNNNNSALFSVQPTISATGTLTYTPAPNANGVATVTVTLSDNGSNIAPNVNTSAAQTFTITVNPVNDAPVFTKGANQTVNENAGPQTVVGWASGIDDGDPELTQTLTFAATNNNSALFSVQPTISATGTLTYTPAPNANGVATITVTLSDNGSNIAPNVNISAAQTFTITVNPVNEAPIAVNDVYTTNEDTQLKMDPSGVLSNDSDPENSALTALLVSTTSNGSLILNPDGSFVYTPSTNFNGTDSFTYQASDGSLSSSIATVTITVNPINDQPLALDDQVLGYEGKPVSFDVLQNDSDVDGDVLTTTILSPPAKGTLKKTGNGTYEYTPESNFYGEDKFTYEVCDNGIPVLCNQATVVLKIFSSIDPIVVYEGISPNDDGMNDTWIIENIDDHPQNSVRIFNRWGDLVFEQQDYDNDVKVWKGNANRGTTLGGDQLPNGTYFYTIQLINSNIIKKGSVVINR